MEPARPKDDLRTELSAWLHLSMLPGLGAAKLRKLLAKLGLPQAIMAASTSELAALLAPELAARLRAGPDSAAQEKIARTLRWLEAPENHLLTLADSHYPQALLDLADAPPLLYATGNLQILQSEMLAMVGARNATAQGLRHAHDFARTMAASGWCVVSGLALGIDSAAHQGALQSGSTLAVVATGLDRVYPPQNLHLAHDIAAHGLLVSEFALGTPAMRHHFPQRNRLVAALSRGILVVEASVRSGSLITAKQGGELGREVFAIPGSIQSPLARGCHQLIRQGAKLVESAQDILEEFQQLPGLNPPLKAPQEPPAPAPDLPNAATPQSTQLLQLLGHEPADFDTLQQASALSVAELMASLSLLEIDGVLGRDTAGRYFLI